MFTARRRRLGLPDQKEKEKHRDVMAQVTHLCLTLDKILICRLSLQSEAVCSRAALPPYRCTSHRPGVAVCTRATLSCWSPVQVREGPLLRTRLSTPQGGRATNLNGKE